MQSAAELTQELGHYHHRAVRDLAWCLLSPPLLTGHNRNFQTVEPAWYHDTYSGYRAHLAELDQQPQPLLAHLQAEPDRRLGSYFESLWAYWLNSNDRYRLLSRRLAVRSGGRTIGEFDFIVHDLSTDRIMHWETAVKFYLGSVAQPGTWLGPRRHDLLVRKWAHLTTRQTQLARTEAGRALLHSHGWSIAATWIITKGRLFYPGGQVQHTPPCAHPVHLRGWWSRASQFAPAQHPPLQWVRLEKRDWLAPLHNDEGRETFNLQVYRQLQQARLAEPVCIAGLVDGREESRGFIVPDGWEGPRTEHSVA